MAKHKPSPGHHTKNQKHRINHCFGCGRDNPDGMHLKFYIDEESRRTICRFRLTRRYQGPPGHAHGGIIATILDEAMGKVNKFRNVLALTKQMDVEYLRPVPLGAPLIVTGYESHVRGRRHVNVAEITNEAGEVLARSKGLFIAVDPLKMFARFIARPEGSRAGTSSTLLPKSPK
jgi:uncharacterized protein (TIGR00369 family)